MNSMGLLRSGTTNRSMVCCGRISIHEGEGIEMSSIPQVEVLCSGRLVGPMALAKKGLCACEYSSDWLRDGFSISPFELPIHKGGRGETKSLWGGRLWSIRRLSSRWLGSSYSRPLSPSEWSSRGVSLFLARQGVSSRHTPPRGSSKESILAFNPSTAPQRASCM